MYFKDSIRGESKSADWARARIARAEKGDATEGSFWRKLFNCGHCELDDGTVGITQTDKIVGEAVHDAIDADMVEESVAPDMGIERAYALEWAVFPLPDPVSRRGL